MRTHVSFPCIPRVYTQETLIVYAKTGRTNIAVALLGMGADVNAYDDIALWNACLHGHLRTVSALIDAGANVNVDNGCLLVMASFDSRYDLARTLIAAGSDIPGRAIYIATYKQNIDIVKALIAGGGNVHYDHERALRVAVATGNTAITDVLLAAGADIRVAIENCSHNSEAVAQLRKLLYTL